jgi:hypothetical protein
VKVTDMNETMQAAVINQWGLRPALIKGTSDIAPLTAFRDLDKLGLLKHVPTLNFHPHLPHYALTNDDGQTVKLLARQPIDPIFGSNVGTGSFTLPRKPVRKRCQAMPQFVATRGGEYRFMPGLRAIRWLAELKT